jgi:LysR family glycine cleavage system transcriptional activator
MPGTTLFSERGSTIAGETLPSLVRWSVMRHARSLANVRPSVISAGASADGLVPRLPRAAWLPPLNALHAFEAAGRYLNFRAAAAELCVTPSAVSRQIKLLEVQLGVALFVRTHRKLQLTSAGSEYLQVVRSAFAALATGTGAVRATTPRPIVRLSLKQPLAAAWLAPRLAAFARRHPAIEIQTLTGNDAVDITSGEFDLAIRFGRGGWPGLRVDPLFRMSLFPVCAPSLCAGPGGLRRIADLSKLPWLHLTSYPHAFRAWLAHAGVPALDSTRHFTFDSVEVLYRAAAHGLGVAMGTRVYVSPDLEARRLVGPFAIEYPLTDSYFLVARGDFARQPAVATVHRWLLDEARATPS